MHTLFPLIDANLHRAKEGLRVVEDICRFVLSDEPLSSRVKDVRHALQGAVPIPYMHLVSSRSHHDVGEARQVPMRKDTRSIFLANINRSMEALRVLEECLPHGEACKNLRYEVYRIEKDIAHVLRKKIPFERDVYVISDDVGVLKEAIKNGARVVQLRDKNASENVLFDKASEMVRYVSDKDVIFIVNDFPLIAQRAGAHGVHIGQDMSTRDTRALIGPEMILGKTTHTLEQGLCAELEGADYISVGPIYATPTKPGREAIGLSYITQAALHIRVPFVTIGGIDRERLPHVLAAGATTIGIVRAHEDVAYFLQQMTSFSPYSNTIHSWSSGYTEQSPIS